MTASETLRAALDAAPGLFVDEDYTGSLTLWREHGDDPAQTLVFATQNGITEDDMRLLGLLLAAAPHLADLLDEPVDYGTPGEANFDKEAYERACERYGAARRIRDAITEAGETR